jgi:unsaturated rhamnogalacturonyl hydrolase
MKTIFSRAAFPLCVALLPLTNSSCAANAAAPKTFSGATPLEWSARLAGSEMSRLTGAPKWDYTMGLFTLSLLKLNEQVPNTNYIPFAEEKVGSLIAADGKIQGYKVEEYQLDALNPAKTALALWHITHDEKYKVAATILRRQLDTQPRTSDGGFWHKQRYTNQMWLDGIYMAGPFYAEYAKLFGETNSFDDVAKQLRLIDEHTYDAKTGLNYHGWDAAKIQSWANPTTGCSSNFWGRAEGWYAMALVDVLDYFPTNHPVRPQIIATFQKTCAGIVKWQDAKTGLWWQVMDQGDRKGNYLEATASAMFVYALAKGVNRGYLPRTDAAAAEKGYDGIVKNLIQDDAGGKWSLTQCCSVAGLGFSNAAGRPRDGSFDYYVSEPVVTNDLKGVGPFILAGIELQRLTNN